MMGLCGVWYQGTHTYLPDEMSNDSNSSDDNRSNTLWYITVTSVHIQEENEKRQPKEEAEDQRKSLSYR